MHCMVPHGAQKGKRSQHPGRHFAEPGMTMTGVESFSSCYKNPCLKLCKDNLEIVYGLPCSWTKMASTFAAPSDMAATLTASWPWGGPTSLLGTMNTTPCTAHVSLFVALQARRGSPWNSAEALDAGVQPVACQCGMTKADAVQN